MSTNLDGALRVPPWYCSATTPCWRLFCRVTNHLVSQHGLKSVAKTTVYHMRNADLKNSRLLWYANNQGSTSPMPTFTKEQKETRRLQKVQLKTNVAIQSRDNVHSCMTWRSSCGDLIRKVLAPSVTATEPGLQHVLRKTLAHCSVKHVHNRRYSPLRLDV
jgi:hypothetical protein